MPPLNAHPAGSPASEPVPGTLPAPAPVPAPVTPGMAQDFLDGFKLIEQEQTDKDRHWLVPVLTPESDKRYVNVPIDDTQTDALLGAPGGEGSGWGFLFPKPTNNYDTVSVPRIAGESDEETARRAQETHNASIAAPGQYAAARLASHLSFGQTSRFTGGFEYRYADDNPLAAWALDTTALTGSFALFPISPPGLAFQAGMKGTARLLPWAASKFGRLALRGVRPSTLNAVEQTLQRAGGQLLANGDIFVPVTERAGAVLGELKAALGALREEAGAVGKEFTIHFGQGVSNEVESMVGARAAEIVGGGAAYGLTAGLSEVSLAPAGQRLEALKELPGKVGEAAFSPLGLGFAALGFLNAGPRGQIKVEPRPTFRLLGAPQDVVTPGMRPLPEPGPRTPPASLQRLWRPTLQLAAPSRYQPAADYYTLFGKWPDQTSDAEFAQHVENPLLKPAAESLRALRVASQETNTELTDLTKQVLDNAKTLRDVKDVSKVLAALRGIEQQPPAATPEAHKALADATVAHTTALRDLPGRDLAPASGLTGFDLSEPLYQGTLMGQPLPAELAPQVHGTARWAVGVMEEARRTPGVSMEALPVLQPQADPASTLHQAGRRVAVLADQVAEANPQARVGPPAELVSIHPELRAVPQVRLEPLTRPQELPLPEFVRPTHAPSPEDFDTEPVAAAVRQGYVTSTLASGSPFGAGALVATNLRGLGPMDQEVIPVVVDREGRPFVMVPHPDQLGQNVAVEATDLRRAALPAAAKWRFEPDRTAPVLFRLDAKTERLVVDQEATAGQRLFQDVLRRASVGEVGRGSMPDPAMDPAGFMQAAADFLKRPEPEGRPHGWLANANSQLHTWALNAPSEGLARNLAGGAFAPPPEVSKEHAKLLQEWALLGAGLEDVRAELLMRDRMHKAAALEMRKQIRSLGAATAEPPAIAGKLVYDKTLKRFSLELQGPNGATSLVAIEDQGAVDPGLADTVVTLPREALNQTSLEGTERRWGPGAANLAEFEAVRRAEALAWLATGRGWTGKADQFAALTDDERYRAMIVRLSGELEPVGRARELQWARLNPANWPVGGYPRYFGEWKPEPYQMRGLQTLWNQRNAELAAGSRVILDLQQAIAAREAGREAPLKPLVDLMKVQLQDLATLKPVEMNEYARQLLKLQLTLSPAEDDRAEAMDLIGKSVNTVLRATEKLGPHQLEEPPEEPLTSSERFIVALRNRITAVTSTTKQTFARPAYISGPYKQAPHARLAGAMMESGEWDAGIQWGDKGLQTGDIRSKELSLRILTDTSQESLAALKQGGPPIKTASGFVYREKTLDRRIFNALNLELSNVGISDHLSDDQSIFEVPVGVRRKGLGLKPLRVDVREAVRKIRAHADDLIRQASDSLVEDAQNMSAGARQDGQTVLAVIRDRELAEAQRENPALVWWEEIPTEELAQIQKRLALEDTGDKTQNPWEPRHYFNLGWVNLDALSYKSLNTMLSTSNAEMLKQGQQAADIEGGSLYRQGHVVFLYKTTRDYILRQLQDPHSWFAKNIDADVMADYLKNRTNPDAQPYASWAKTWPLYVTALADQIHVERAVRYTKLKLPQLPPGQRANVEAQIAGMRGLFQPYEVNMNRAAYYEALAQPRLVDDFVSALTAGRKNARDLALKARAGGKVSQNLATDLLHEYLQATYLGLFGPIKIAMQTLTEPAFLARELLKEPTKAPSALKDAAISAALTVGRGVGELGSAIANDLAGTPLWYSEPTKMQVNQIVQDIYEEFGLFREGQRSGDPILALIHGASKVLYPFARASEFFVRSTNYEYFKRRLLYYYPNMQLDPAMEFGSVMANWSVGSFGPREVNPNTRTGVMPLIMPGKRFTAGKIEQGLMDVSGTREGLSNFMRGGAPEFRREDYGMMPPPPKGPPPPVPGSPFNDWSDDQLAALARHNEEAPLYGAGYPASGDASKVHFNAMLGMIASFGVLATLGSLLFKDKDSPLASLNPFSLANLDEVSGFYWLNNAYTVMTLGAKNYLLGLNAADVQKLSKAIDGVTHEGPIYGKMLAEVDRRARAERQRRAASGDKNWRTPAPSFAARGRMLAEAGGAALGGDMSGALARGNQAFSDVGGSIQGAIGLNDQILAKASRLTTQFPPGAAPRKQALTKGVLPQLLEDAKSLVNDEHPTP